MQYKALINYTAPTIQKTTTIKTMLSCERYATLMIMMVDGGFPTCSRLEGTGVLPNTTNFDKKKPS